jgi:hypothetical protein
MNRTDEGIITDKLHPPKALVSIRLSRESGSNEIDESDSQFEKHDDPRISTFRGISIDSSDEDVNAFDSIRFNREFD